MDQLIHRCYRHLQCLLHGLVECLILIGKLLKSALCYFLIRTSPIRNSTWLRCVNVMPCPTWQPCKQNTQPHSYLQLKVHLKIYLINTLVFQDVRVAIGWTPSATLVEYFHYCQEGNTSFCRRDGARK